MKVQEWLDEKYSNKSTEEIDLSCLQANEGEELVISDFPNLKEIKGGSEKFNIKKITIRNCPKLKEVEIGNFKDNKELNLINLPKLWKFHCFNNQLTKLDLSQVDKLSMLRCENNQLTSLEFLRQLSHPENLSYLNISNNKFCPQDLSIFGGFKNLKSLYLANNSFYGSLKPLQNLVRLDKLEIDNTDIDDGLEYLPISLKELHFSDDECEPAVKVKKIYEELWAYGWNLDAWRVVNPELVRKDELDILDNEKLKTKALKQVPTMLPQLFKMKKTKFKEDYNIEEINYKEIVLGDRHPFSWELKENGSLIPKRLPFRLYNIKENKIENTEGQVGRYAILSYVWGWNHKLSGEAKKELENIWNKSNLGFKNEVKGLGYKTLKKAINTCELIGIDYLWMDQLCINQSEQTQEEIEEMNQEVTKMRQYYSNAEATLIAINVKSNQKKTRRFPSDVLEKIINSEWFSRSWTFQEGWLSKQTIFMFDDVLVDGRNMAQAWTTRQSYDRYYYSEATRNVEKVATPLGWVYYRWGYSLEDEVSLSLNEALRTIKNRGRSIPVDGVYSILGLLPYGHEVKPKYKKFGESYTKEELEDVLYEVMKVAVKNGYGEPLAWYGVSNVTPGRCWMPQIDEEGSTNIQGTVNVICLPEKVTFQPNGSLKINGAEYIVIYHDVSPGGDISNSLTDDGSISSGRIAIMDEFGEKYEGVGESGLNFQGMRETLEKIKKGDTLIVPNEKQWKSKKMFAILVTKKDGIYHRVGSVQFETEKEFEKLKETELDKEIIIGMISNQASSPIEDCSQHEYLTEIPLRK